MLDPTPLTAEGQVDYKSLAKQQPFFAIVNLTHSHESSAHGNVDHTEHDPEKVKLAPYHPDLPVIRKNYAKYQDAVLRMDSHVGRNLDALRDAGLKENTVVIYNSDHGGVMPRSKRFLLESGIHCPLIVRIPKKFKSHYPTNEQKQPLSPGTAVDRIVSFIDIPITWMSLADAAVPDAMQGNIFLGPEARAPRQFAPAYRGRMDERCDVARAIRNNRYLYIRHFMPYVPRGQYLAYLWRAPAAGAWQTHHLAGKTDTVTGRFFRPKPLEELFDTATDPHCIDNLAFDPASRDRLVKMRSQLRQWQLEHFDAGLLPESEMVLRAKKHGLTIYEMVRNAEIYPLADLLDAADAALQSEEHVNLDKLVNMLDSRDSGIRYWACVGLFRLGPGARGQKDALRRMLDDTSDEVVAMAAWALYNLGEESLARRRLRTLLEDNSPASLKVVNIIDWMGDDPSYYHTAMIECQPPLMASYLGRWKQQARQAAESQ